MSNNDSSDGDYSFLEDLTGGLGQDNWDQLLTVPAAVAASDANRSQSSGPDNPMYPSARTIQGMSNLSYNAEHTPQPQQNPFSAYQPSLFSQSTNQAQPSELFEVQGQSQSNPFQSQPDSFDLSQSQPLEQSFSASHENAQYSLALPIPRQNDPPQQSSFMPQQNFSARPPLPLPIPEPVFPPQQPAPHALTAAQIVDNFLASIGHNQAVLDELSRRFAGNQQQIHTTQAALPLQGPSISHEMSYQGSQHSIAGGLGNTGVPDSGNFPPPSAIAPFGDHLQIASDGLPYHTDPPPDRKDPGNTDSREIIMKKNNAFWSDRSDRAEWSRKYDNFYGKLRPHMLPAWGPNGKFEYDGNGELVKGRTLSRNQIYYYLYNNPRRLTLMLQLAPSKLLVRMSESSCTCRWKSCPLASKTIHNTHMVTFQEFQPEVEVGRHNPYRSAGMVHLFCFEQMFDIAPMIQSGFLRPEHHRMPAERDNNLSIERDRKGVVENAYNKWVRGKTHTPHPRAYPDSLQYALTLHFHETRPESHKRQAEKRDRNRGRPTVSAVHVHWNDLRILANLKPSGVSEMYSTWYRETYGTSYDPHRAIQELIDAGHQEDDSLEVAILAAESTGAPRPIFREALQTGLPSVPSVRPAAADSSSTRKRARQSQERDDRAAKRSRRNARSNSGSSGDEVVPAAPPIVPLPSTAAPLVLSGENAAESNLVSTGAEMTNTASAPVAAAPGSLGDSVPDFNLGALQALDATAYNTGPLADQEDGAPMPVNVGEQADVQMHVSQEPMANQAANAAVVEQEDDDLFGDEGDPSLDVSNQDIDKLLSYGEF